MKKMQAKYWYAMLAMTAMNVVACGVAILFGFKNPSLRTQSGIPFLFVIISILVCGLVTVLFLSFVCILFSPPSESGVTEHVRHWLLSRKSLLIRLMMEVFGDVGRYVVRIMFLAAIVLVISLACLWVWAMALGDDKADTYVLRSPGVVFAMFMASITIIGFSHTVKKIIESNYLITNYQLLLHTARNMISEATKEEYARIRMICVTPCHGNYSERRTKAYTKYLDQITAISERTANNAYFDLICYDAADWSTDEANKSPLQKFYEQYEESDLRTAAFEEAEGFLADLESQRGKDEKQQINRRRHTHDMTLAQERAHLPSYRLLLTTNAAICYFPVDMSIKSLPADNTQHHEQIRRVEMLGFTTRVGYIVDWLELHFEHIKHEVGLEDQSQ